MKVPLADEDVAHLQRLPPCAEAVRAVVGCLEELKLRGLAELAAGAAHEINNPLAIISGQAQHLLKTEESPERIHALQRIVAQSRRIHDLLNDLMLYARPPRPKRRRVAVARLLDEAIQALADLALERRVQVRVDRPGDKLRLDADPHLLGVALECLIRNGIEAAPAEGWVRVGAEPADEHTRIIVEDNGPGLGSVQREHLFDPFYSGRSAGRGVGLGLSKAWRIAQVHGGRLDCESETGRPTRFVLSLPAAEVEEQARRSPPPRRITHVNGKARTARNGNTTRRRR